MAPAQACGDGSPHTLPCFCICFDCRYVNTEMAPAARPPPGQRAKISLCRHSRSPHACVHTHTAAADGNELLLSDVLGSDQNQVGADLEQLAERDMLRQAVERLPDRERTIMSLRYGLGGGKEHTQKEVADLIGISQSYISRLEKRIIKRLRNELEHSC